MPKYAQNIRQKSGVDLNLAHVLDFLLFAELFAQLVDVRLLLLDLFLGLPHLAYVLRARATGKGETTTTLTQHS